jgi:cytochrome c553
MGRDLPGSRHYRTLRIPSRIAWTSSTLGQIRAGNAQHGSFIALNCTACRGEGGVSKSTFIPVLAGMDSAAIFKQLDDYRFSKRLWGVMGTIAKALSTRRLISRSAQTG